MMGLAHRLGLVALAVSLSMVAPAGAVVFPLFPLNGSFSQGSSWWSARGDVVFEGDDARFNTSNYQWCMADESVPGEVGAITSTLIPNLNFQSLQVRLRVSSADTRDKFEVWAVGSSQRWLVLQEGWSIAPNCTELERLVTVRMPPLLLAAEPSFQLEVRVVENGDSLHARIWLHEVGLTHT